MNASPTAASVHVGTPPPDFNGWTTTKVYVHGFANLSAVRNVPVASPEFIALGNPWRLMLYPGGVVREGWVAIYLRNWSNESIDVNVGFSINDGNGKQVVYEQSPGPRNFAPMGDADGYDYWGWFNFATRLSLLSSLINGALVIGVHMKLQQPAKLSPPQFIPENPFNENMLQMLNDEDLSI